MLHDWLELPLGDVITLQRGFDLPNRERRPGNIPVVSSSGISGTHSEAKVSAPGVVTGRYGTIGQVFYIKEDYWPLNTTLFVKDFKGNHPLFISFLLRTIDFQSCSDKSSVPGLNRNDLHLIKVKLPPLPEQKAIAHILGTLDDKIELNREMNRTLEAMARAIFQSWFVDFDPVRAKMEGRLPAGMDAATTELFPSEFEESALGIIPKGWEIKQINNICNVTRGASPRPIHDYIGGEVPWIKIADATAAEGLFVFETKETIKREGVSKSVAVYPGDLILSNSATCGVPIFVEVEGCIHDGWLLFRNFQIISKGYLYHLLYSISQHLIHIADGSVQKNLNTKLVGEQLLVVPEENLVKAFDIINDTFLAKIRMNTLESRTLASLRDTLIPKLLSGEIRVKEAEKVVAKVL